MTLNTNLVDLSVVVGMLASWGIVPHALQFLRDVFLDSLLMRASDAQRTAILRAMLFVLSLVAVLGLALILGQQMSLSLLISAVLAASGGAVGAHASYVKFSQRVSSSDPAGMSAAPDPTTADGAPGAA